MLARTVLIGLVVLLGGCADGAATGGSGAASGFGGASGSSGAGAAPNQNAGTSGAPGGGGTVAADGGQGGSGGAQSAGAPSAGAGGAVSGGTSGSGGMSGAAGAGGGASANCPASAVFCEDFENGLDAWAKEESGGTLAIDGTHVTSGQSALGITMATGQRGGWLERTGAPLFPLPMNAIYGRVMMYFESLPAGHTDFIRAASTNGQTPWYNVGEQTGKVLLNYFGNGSDCWARPSPSTNIPLQTWMCWEWVYDGAQDQMQFFIDGELMRTVDGVGDGCSGPNVWNAPQFNYLAIGAYNAQPNNSPSVGKMWFDDVAVGTTGRVGCPSATNQ